MSITDSTQAPIPVATGNSAENAPPAPAREQGIPLREDQVVRLIVEALGLDDRDAQQLGSSARRISDALHGEFRERLKTLKCLYAPFDPDSETVDVSGTDAHPPAAEAFFHALEDELKRANFRELDLHALREAGNAPNELGLNYMPDFSLFELLKVYRRGSCRVRRPYRSLKTFYRLRWVDHDAYQRLVIALKFRRGHGLDGYVRDDVIYLRYFKDVPCVDMEMHLPEQTTRARMRWSDRAQIASPLVLGLPTALGKLFLASLMSPVLVGTVLVGTVSAGVKSFFGFQRARQKLLLHMIRHLYYMTLANNASVLTKLIDTGEDQEYLESVLAYAFLRYSAPSEAPARTKRELDARIEAFLRRVSGKDINFEIGDALGKLLRLGFVRRGDDGELMAVDLDRLPS